MLARFLVKVNFPVLITFVDLKCVSRKSCPIISIGTLTPPFTPFIKVGDNLHLYTIASETEWMIPCSRGYLLFPLSL